MSFCLTFAKHAGMKEVDGQSVWNTKHYKGLPATRLSFLRVLSEEAVLAPFG